MVGAVSAVIDIIVLNICYGHLHMSVYLATFLGYFVGAINGYLMNNFWTYRRQNRPFHIFGLIQYTAISFVGLGLTELVIRLVSVGLGYNVNVGKIISIVLVSFWNFFANRVTTFKEAKVPVV